MASEDPLISDLLGRDSKHLKYSVYRARRPSNGIPVPSPHSDLLGPGRRSNYTRYLILLRGLIAQALNTIDTTTVACLNWLTTVIFACLFLLGLALHVPLRAAMDFIRRKVYPVIIGGRTIELSSVNVVSPETFKRYTPIYSETCAKKQRERHYVRIAFKEFDLTNAIFFAHLCALSYETLDNAAHIAEQWDLGTYAFFRDSSAACCLFHSKLHNFLVVAFKGTSPMNLQDWLTDCEISPASASGDALPGNLHKGFLDLFEFQTRTLNTQLAESQKDAGYYNSLLREINECITREGLEKPRVWITGHSLGAALATLFYSALVYSPHSPIAEGESIDLCGCYAFGSPRVGDTAFNVGMNYLKQYHYYRISNGNDLVPFLPPRLSVGSFLRSKSLFDYKHIGAPVQISCAGSVTFKPSLDLVGFTLNYLEYWKSIVRLPLTTFVHGGVGELEGWNLGPRRTTVFAAILRVLLPSMVVDHMPNEYIDHLVLARERETGCDMPACRSNTTGEGARCQARVSDEEVQPVCQE